jgi:hypothetical protein
MRRIIAISVCIFVAASVALAAAPSAVRFPKPRPALATDAPDRSRASREPVSALADVAPLPRSRPSIEPETEVADWAKKAASRFNAAASGKSTPTAAHTDMATTDRSGAVDQSVGALGAIEGLAPLPRARPQTRGPELALIMPPRVEPMSPGLVAPEDAGCIDRIRALGVEFTEQPPLDVEGSCSVPHPLKVTNLGSGVSIGQDTILNCAETESLARWMKDIVVPSATKLLGSPPNRIAQNSSYVCRTRYNDPNEKISEHAHANAIDIASFSFAGRAPVGIGAANKEGTPEAHFEAEIRKGACTYFTTVLGPGSNAAHATHFHLDMAFRHGGYRLCELGGPTMVAAPANTKRE